MVKLIKKGILLKNPYRIYLQYTSFSIIYFFSQPIWSGSILKDEMILSNSFLFQIWLSLEADIFIRYVIIFNHVFVVLRSRMRIQPSARIVESLKRKIFTRLDFHLNPWVKGSFTKYLTLFYIRFKINGSFLSSFTFWQFFNKHSL